METRKRGMEAEPMEGPESRVVLHFIRHGKKNKTLEGQSDNDVLLTPEGVTQARAVGKEFNPNIETSVAIGSPRKRAQEVAGRAMLANEESITPEMTLEEINEEIFKELKYGKKITSDPRLNFYDEEKNELKRLTDEAYAQKRTAEFMIHESDEIARRIHDRNGSTYTRLAGQVASLVKKYSMIGNNFHRIVEQDPAKYVSAKNQLERYLGTHNTVSDSFVAKVLEKVYGVEERENFLQAVGPLGFKEAEGFGIEIVDKPGNQEIVMHVVVNGQEWHVPVPGELLDEMMRDAEKFNQEVIK